MEDSVLTNVCRSCLKEEGEFQSIFVRDETTDLDIHLAEMIMAYASVQITFGDGLPEQICSPCARKASDLFLFKRQCEESDTALRERLGKSPLHRALFITDDQKFPPDFDVNTNLDYNVKAELIYDNTDDCDDFDDSIEEVKIMSGEDIEDNDPPKIVETPVFQCEVCFKKFMRLNHLNRHKKVHGTSARYKCDICQQIFARADLLHKHKLGHQVKLEEQNVEFDRIIDQDMLVENLLDVKYVANELKCATCNVSFADLKQYSSHAEKQHGRKEKEINVACEVCHKKFTKNSHLTRHLKIHAAIKPHACKLCNKGFARTEQLLNHMNVHSGVKPHVCQICSKGFNQISNLKDHMRTHNGEKPFLCSTCGKGFNQLGNLRQHTIRHSGVKAHICSICGHGFASKGELCAHLRKHTGARPFVCPVCNNGFTTSSSLTKHKRIHSGEKPYECEVCKMKFSRSGILARHKRTHTGEKPYVCKYCTKAFSQSNDLSSHLRIHTGEKPFICDTCGQTFRQSSALKSHKKTHIDRNSILDSRVVMGIVHNIFE